MLMGRKHGRSGQGCFAYNTAIVKNLKICFSKVWPSTRLLQAMSHIKKQNELLWLGWQNTFQNSSEPSRAIMALLFQDIINFQWEHFELEWIKFLSSNYQAIKCIECDEVICNS